MILVTAVAIALAVYGRRDPPPDFDVAKVEAEASQYLQVNRPLHVVAEVQLLAWHVMEDSRPFRVTKALVGARLESTSGERTWSLLQLFGPPDESWWSVSYVDDAPFDGERPFAYPPKNSDVYDFLSQPMFEWEWKPKDDWKILVGDVLDEAWTESIGERPTKFYPTGIER